MLDEVIFPSDAKARLDCTHIIKGWIAENSISVVYGPSNVGKSFFCMSLAYHIAAAKRMGGQQSRQTRIGPISSHRGREYFSEPTIRATQETRVQRCVACGSSFAHQSIRRRRGHRKYHNAPEIGKRMEPVTVLVIDTLARATAGQMDENNNSEMSKLIAGLDAIRERTGVHIMLVHHSGKDTLVLRAWGRALRAACDTEIELSFDEETRGAHRKSN